MRLSIAAEDQLCLLLARGALTSKAQEEACGLLAKSLHWDLILARAVAHEIYPLLYHNLQKLGFASVPEHVCTKLEALYRINAFRNVQLIDELTRVLGLLRDAGIRTIPLKGVTLARSLYGDPSLRVCADIDILVPPHDASHAFHTLRSYGYQAEFAGRYFEELFLRTGIEYDLTRKDRGICYLVDLHWGVLWGTPWDRNCAEELWREAEAKTCFGVPVYALRPEWEFLFLAAHVTRHRWQGLKWLVDIHELCSRGEIDFEKVAEKARLYGWQQTIEVTLGVCHAFFDTRMPAAIALRPLPSWVKLFPAAFSRVDICKNVLLPTRLLPGPAAKLRYLFRVLCVPTLAELSLLRLPSRLVYLYYPLRGLRLGFKWAFISMSGILSWIRR